MTVNLTLTENQVYLAIIVLLLILQVYQQYQIHKLKKNFEHLWGQFAMVVLNIGNKLQELEFKSQNQDIK